MIVFLEKILRQERMTGMCEVLKEMLILYRNKYTNHTEPSDFVY